MAAVLMLIAPIIAVLDTCVLIPSRLRDLLLEVAAVGLYECRWSDQTLDELRRNTVRLNVERGMDSAGIDRKVRILITNLRAAFPDATVSVSNYAQHMEDAANATNDPGDRHVIAAALACGAGIIVTDNTRHFHNEALAHLGLPSATADIFLTTLFASHAEDVLRAMANQLAVYRRPPMTLDELLIKLSRSIPNFVAHVRASYPASPSA